MPALPMRAHIVGTVPWTVTRMRGNGYLWEGKPVFWLESTGDTVLLWLFDKAMSAAYAQPLAATARRITLTLDRSATHNGR